MSEFTPNLLAEEAAKEVEYRFIGMKRAPNDRDWVEAIEWTLERFPALDAIAVEELENDNDAMRELIYAIEAAVSDRKGEVFDKIRMLIQRRWWP